MSVESKQINSTNTSAASAPSSSRGLAQESPFSSFVDIASIAQNALAEARAFGNSSSFSTCIKENRSWTCSLPTLRSSNSSDLSSSSSSQGAASAPQNFEHFRELPPRINEVKQSVNDQSIWTNCSEQRAKEVLRGARTGSFILRHTEEGLSIVVKTNHEQAQTFALQYSPALGFLKLEGCENSFSLEEGLGDRDLKNRINDGFMRIFQELTPHLFPDIEKRVTEHNR